MDFAWIVMDLPTEGVSVARVALEKHYSRPICAFATSFGGWSNEASVDLLAIDLKLELIHAPSRRLRVIPEAEG